MKVWKVNPTKIPPVTIPVIFWFSVGLDIGIFSLGWKSFVAPHTI